MKPCNYCAEPIQDAAIKCRYCGSSLVAPPAPAVPAAAADAAKTITYVLDTDLVRFAKFSGAVLALFLVVGAYLYGIDLKQAAKEIKDSQEEVKKVHHDILESKATVQQLNVEAAALLAQARSQIALISKSSEEARGIVSALPRVAGGADEVRQQVEALLAPVLSAEQLSRLRDGAAASAQAALSLADARRLIAADIDRTLTYFAARGLGGRKVPFEINKDRNFTNAYWDGAKVVYGMGMANSDAFGPYESGIVIHEATHAFFDISFEGESGSISEHVCDVMAVVIRGGPWSLGSVRGRPGAKPQALRSLEAPGSAFDSALIGKDAQVDHMKRFVRDSADNGGVHINNGILNKAAFLMAEGGEFSGVKVGSGIGREVLGKLYAGVIAKLSGRPAWKFLEFRDLVLRVAREQGLDDKSLDVLRKAYSAVGL